MVVASREQVLLLVRLERLWQQPSSTICQALSRSRAADGIVQTPY